MGLISLVCPNCNGVLELDDNRKQYFCQFCGSKVVLEDKKIEINGNITLDGGIAAENLIERGYQYLEDRNFSNAENSFNRALDINARKWKAFIGLLLCELEYTEIELLSKNIRPMIEYDNFNKALRFADGADKAMLEEISEQTNKNCEEAKVRVQEVLDDLYAEKNELEINHDKLTKKRNTFIKLKNSFKPVMIILWIAAGISFFIRVGQISNMSYNSATTTVFTVSFLLALAFTISRFVFDGTSKNTQDDINENFQKQTDILTRIASLKTQYSFIKFKNNDEYNN